MKAERDDENGLTAQGSTRRRFLTATALATAGASSGGLLAARVRAEAAPPASCPEVKTPMKEVEGKVAFVTGGASGIGLGIAEAFVNAGMKVVVADISAERIEEAMAKFAGAGQSKQVHPIRVNVTDRPAMRQAAAETVKVFGKVHALINNAGVALPPTLEQTTYKEWDWMMDVNVTGVFNGIKEFLPHIKAHGEGGQIITTSSIMGLFIFGGAGGVYSLSKFAVIGMMESLRAELADSNIGASAFCPGLVKSNVMTSSLRDRPKDPAGIQVDQKTIEQDRKSRDNPEIAMDPLEVGELVLRGMRNNDLYIFTSPEYEKIMRDRNEALIAALPRDMKLTKTRAATARTGFKTNLYSVERDRKLCAQRGRKT